MTILDDLTKHLTRLAMNEVALLKLEGYAEPEILDIVTANNLLRCEGLAAGLGAVVCDLERRAAVAP